MAYLNGLESTIDIVKHEILDEHESLYQPEQIFIKHDYLEGNDLCGEGEKCIGTSSRDNGAVLSEEGNKEQTDPLRIMRPTISVIQLERLKELSTKSRKIPITSILAPINEAFFKQQPTSREESSNVVEDISEPPTTIAEEFFVTSVMSENNMSQRKGNQLKIYPSCKSKRGSKFIKAPQAACHLKYRGEQTGTVQPAVLKSAKECEVTLKDFIEPSNLLEEKMECSESIDPLNSRKEDFIFPDVKVELDCVSFEDAIDVKVTVEKLGEPPSESTRRSLEATQMEELQRARLAAREIEESMQTECDFTVSRKKHLTRRKSGGNKRSMCMRKCWLRLKQVEWEKREALKAAALKATEESVARLEAKMGLTCNECGECFYLRRRLRRHMLSHFDLDTWSCDTCKKTFFKESSLGKHMAKTHPAVVKIPEESEDYLDSTNEDLLITNDEVSEEDVTEARVRREHFLLSTMSRLLLNQKQASEILLEDIPDDDGDTDIESEDEADENSAGPSVPWDPSNGTTNETVQGDSDDSDNDMPLPQIAAATNSRSKRMVAEINRKWRKETVDSLIPDFHQPQGTVEDLFAACETPTDVFRVLIDPIIGPITCQTNLYAMQKGKILDMKEHELLAHIGINFLMSYNKLPSWRHYWATASDLNVPAVSSTMSRDRFDAILSSLHVNDNTSMPVPNKDKLYKLRPMIDELNNQFQTAYNCTREVSVDESMVVFQGCSSLKQYNSTKAIKCGYKLWCLADQKGYIQKFKICQGKGEQSENDYKNFGLGERVVLEMTKHLWGKNYLVFFDNFFTSLPLLEKLKLEGVMGCGKIRSNHRGLPKLQPDVLLKRGEGDHRSSSMGISVFKWRDNRRRIVHFASNFHGTEEATVGWRERDGSESQINCPTIVRDYNSFMGGVDHADQLRGTYGVDRKSKKWWHRLFYALLDIAFVNSFIIFKDIFPTNTINLLNFRRDVSRGLMAQRVTEAMVQVPSHKRRKLNFSVPADVRLGNRGAHWPIFGKSRGRCEQCSSKKIESRPFTRCVMCKIYLCCNERKNCFNEYHNVAS